MQLFNFYLIMFLTFLPFYQNIRLPNNSLEEQPQFVYDENGQITGYTTKIGGADTVFPFKNKDYVYAYFSNEGTDIKEIQYVAPVDTTISAIGCAADGWGVSINLYINDTLIDSCGSNSVTTGFMHQKNLQVCKNDVVKLSGKCNCGNGELAMAIFAETNVK